MSNLFGNHIVGFPTRRLKWYWLLCSQRTIVNRDDKKQTKMVRVHFSDPDQVPSFFHAHLNMSSSSQLSIKIKLLIILKKPKYIEIEGFELQACNLSC